MIPLHCQVEGCPALKVCGIDIRIITEQQIYHIAMATTQYGTMQAGLTMDLPLFDHVDVSFHFESFLCICDIILLYCFKQCSIPILQGRCDCTACVSNWTWSSRNLMCAKALWNLLLTNTNALPGYSSLSLGLATHSDLLLCRCRECQLSALLLCVLLLCLLKLLRLLLLLVLLLLLL